MFKRKDKKYQEQLARLEQMEKEIESLRKEISEFKCDQLMREVKRIANG